MSEQDAGGGLVDKARRAADKVDAALEPDGSEKTNGLSANSAGSDPLTNDTRTDEQGTGGGAEPDRES